MAEPNANVVPPAPRNPDEVIVPSAGLEPWTCPWAQDGLRKAMEGYVAGSGSGVSGYRIGSRAVQYRSASEQLAVVSWWQKAVEICCGTEELPSALTGRDTAIRVVPRDV